MFVVVLNAPSEGDLEALCKGFQETFQKSFTKNPFKMEFFLHIVGGLKTLNNFCRNLCFRCLTEF